LNYVDAEREICRAAVARVLEACLAGTHLARADAQPLLGDLVRAGASHLEIFKGRFRDRPNAFGPLARSRAVELHDLRDVDRAVLFEGTARGLRRPFTPRGHWPTLAKGSKKTCSTGPDRCWSRIAPAPGTRRTMEDAPAAPGNWPGDAWEVTRSNMESLFGGNVRGASLNMVEREHPAQLETTDP
jgi:hypothetical protein